MALNFPLSIFSPSKYAPQYGSVETFWRGEPSANLIYCDLVLLCGAEEGQATWYETEHVTAINWGRGGGGDGVRSTRFDSILVCLLLLWVRSGIWVEVGTPRVNYCIMHSDIDIIITINSDQLRDKGGEVVNELYSKLWLSTRKQEMCSGEGTYTHSYTQCEGHYHSPLLDRLDDILEIPELGRSTDAL